MNGPNPDIQGQRTAAGKLAVCKWLRAQVDAWEADAKAELLESGMLPGLRQPAVLAGHVVGIVSMRAGQRRFKPDNTQLAEWVAERWPDQVEHVAQILPAFKASLKDRAVDGVLIDDDGEVCPWAEVVQGEPVSVVTDPDLDMIGGVVQELLQSGYTIDSLIRELPSSAAT